MSKKIESPKAFLCLEELGCIKASDVISSNDGFFIINKSISDILANKGIFKFIDSDGELLNCDKFFDDWYVYAVSCNNSYTYSLFKMREQEHDAACSEIAADGDSPGVTISFISFKIEALIECLKEPNNINLSVINKEINKVVSYSGQTHSKALKGYFINPSALGAYLVASLYVNYIASLATDGGIELPVHYKKIVQQSRSYKNVYKFSRLPDYVDTLNKKTQFKLCNDEKIFIKDANNISDIEGGVILATHTGNCSIHSFAAEVEYHARFLTAFAKIKIPFFSKSIYNSAVRADMTIDDNEFEGPAPFYKHNSHIVKRQIKLHKNVGFSMIKDYL